MRLNYPGIKLESALGTKLNICHHILTSSTQLQKRSFHVIERTRTSSKDEICTCKACKNTVFHCQMCKFVRFLLPSSWWLLKLPSSAPREELIVFAYRIWKPQFLSVVQFTFDNWQSPFSPTTFFEISVYIAAAVSTYILACNLMQMS